MEQSKKYKRQVSPKLINMILDDEKQSKIHELAKERDRIINELYCISNEVEKELIGCIDTENEIKIEIKYIEYTDTSYFAFVPNYQRVQVKKND